MVEWTMELNNLLQKHGRAGNVTYEDKHEGPDNQGEWLVNCLEQGKIAGTGRGKTKREAKEVASKNAMKILYPSHYTSFGGK